MPRRPPLHGGASCQSGCVLLPTATANDRLLRAQGHAGVVAEPRRRPVCARASCDRTTSRTRSRATLPVQALVPFAIELPPRLTGEKSGGDAAGAWRLCDVLIGRTVAVNLMMRARSRRRCRRRKGERIPLGGALRGHDIGTVVSRCSAAAS